jgi:hypothetical protein
MVGVDLGGTGVVRLEGAFSSEDAARMRDVVWDEPVRRHGMQRRRQSRRRHPLDVAPSPDS